VGGRGALRICIWAPHLYLSPLPSLSYLALGKCSNAVLAIKSHKQVARIQEKPHLINVLKEECYNNDIFSGIHKNSTCANGLQISKDSSEVLKLQF
jgi:hypothetical protein